MKHLDWLSTLARDVQGVLEDWAEIASPNAAYQKHYEASDVAEALRLSPITVRQYIREGRLVGRKLGRKWEVSVDSIARYIYTARGGETDPEIPMGVVYVWADEHGSILADYAFVGDKELASFASYDDLKRFMRVREGSPYWCELWPALTQDTLLEDIAMITKGIERGEKYSSRLYALPAMVEYKMAHLALSEWYKMESTHIVAWFKEVFGREPDITDLRILRWALLGIAQINEQQEHVKKTLRALDGLLEFEQFWKLEVKGETGNNARSEP